MRGKIYSVRSRSRRALLLFSGALILFLILFSTISARILFENTSSQMQELLSLYNGEVSSSLKSVDYYLMDINNFSPDISLLAVQKGTSSSYNSVNNVQNLFSFTLNSFPNVICLFGYFPRSQIFLYQSQAINTYRDSIGDLRSRFREGNAFVDSLRSNVRSWQLVELDGKTFFLKLYEQNGAYLGAFTTPELLCEALSGLKERQALIFYTDSEGRPAAWQDKETAALTEGLTFPPETEGRTEDHAFYRIGGAPYLAIRSPLSYCDYEIMAMIPASEIVGPIRLMIALVLLLILVVIAFTVLLMTSAATIMTRPMQLIADASSRIREGNADARIETEGLRAKELLDISDAINHLTESLRRSKIDFYEEQLQKNQIEMQFLQNQVSPHFLINCLNMISFLADGTKEHTDLLKKMIAELSIHLRYTLKTRKAVPLSEEITFVRNYIDMTNIRFPGCLETTIEMDESVADASVFPLIVLMHTENTFKFNLVMGEKLTLIIRVQGFEENGKKRVRITHIDSGSGFTEDILASYRGQGSPEPEHERAHIGIRNAIRRLELYYGGDARQVLSNEPGLGARIDIEFPYIPYRAENAAREDHGLRKGDV